MMVLSVVASGGLLWLIVIVSGGLAVVDSMVDESGS